MIANGWRCWDRLLVNVDPDGSITRGCYVRSNVKTTQRYCRVSNLKAQRDYFNAMEAILRQRLASPDST
jgi:hypothetical protein